MKEKTVIRAIAVAWVIAALCIIVKTAREENEMRTLNISVEITEMQYDAMREIAAGKTKSPADWTAEDEITQTARIAVWRKADDHMRPPSGTMPRQNGIVGMEVADAEYLLLTKEIRDGQNSNDTGTLPDDKGQITASVPDSGRLTRELGVFEGPSGKETWYNLPMAGVIDIMRILGYDEGKYPYWTREDGCRMLGNYIIIAAELESRPRGTILETSLGQGIVCDTGAFTRKNPTQIDIAVDW